MKPTKTEKIWKWKKEQIKHDLWVFIILLLVIILIAFMVWASINYPKLFYIFIFIFSIIFFVFAIYYIIKEML